MGIIAIITITMIMVAKVVYGRLLVIVFVISLIIPIKNMHDIYSD